MIWLTTFCLLGIPVGFMLLWRVPLCRPQSNPCHDAISVIIPARNEAENLPRLLSSIFQSEERPAEVLVIDDDSTDGTAAVAESQGASVFASRCLPSNWTGKTWSCYQGALHASSDVLLFLDADTYFLPDGYRRLADLFCGAGDSSIVMSVLPFHVMQKPYEELSLFFNLLMAIGAGGFGMLGAPSLFGQSLIISRDLYIASGGHQAVSSTILENLVLSSKVKSVGGRCVCFGGRGVLNIRMFPDGLSQLCEGWAKAFADGAAASPAPILGLAILWLTALSACFLGLLLGSGMVRVLFAMLYLSFVSQLFIFARQIGNFRAVTCLLYPIPLVFYFGLFAHSLYLRLFRRRVTWRGRTL